MKVLCFVALVAFLFAGAFADCHEKSDAMRAHCISRCRNEKSPSRYSSCMTICNQFETICEDKCITKNALYFDEEDYFTLAKSTKKSNTPAAPPAPSAEYRTPKGGLVPAGVGPFGKTSRYPQTGYEYCPQPYTSYYVVTGPNTTESTGELVCVSTCPFNFYPVANDEGNKYCKNPISNYGGW